MALTLLSAGLAACSSDSKDSGGAPPKSGITDPYVRAGGLGVTDLDAASAFLTGIVGMSQEGPDVVRTDRTERTFWAKEADRGSRVVLMKYSDGRRIENVPAKLVFQAKDVQGTYDAAVAAGYASILPPISLSTILVSQVKGPDGYTVEILSGLDAAGADVAKPYFIALAFGVSDFTASRKFYADAFGMVETLPYTTDDLVEQTMEYPKAGGAGLVLQHYEITQYNYRGNPVKHVSFVPDVEAATAAVKSAGGTVVSEPAPTPAYEGRPGAVLADPDGVTIELVED
jgi:catechol 2,3-dioxygenase-like lactoylglutathione lyase family enzyme